MVPDFGDKQRPCRTNLHTKGIFHIDRPRRALIAIVLSLPRPSDRLDGGGPSGQHGKASNGNRT